MFTHDWFSHHIAAWKRWLGGLAGRPHLQFLELGSFEGLASCWLLENILTDPTSRLTCIDPWQGAITGSSDDSEAVYQRFLQNTRPHAERLEVRRGISLVELRACQAAGRKFDFIYIDGDHAGQAVLSDAVLAWDLLKPGGLLVLDDYFWSHPQVSVPPGPAIDAFLSVARDQLQTELSECGQMACWRRGEPSGETSPPWLVGVTSRREPNAARAACLETWAGSDRPAQVDVVYIVGRGTGPLPVREGDLLLCPCEDEYPFLPSKVRWFLVWALLNSRAERLFKCDDDTYVALSRLVHSGISADFAGCDLGGFASGGAGYALSRAAAAAILGQLSAVEGPEDVLVAQALSRAGIPLHHDERFRPDMQSLPLRDNHLITCHYCPPQQMAQVHAAYIR